MTLTLFGHDTSPYVRRVRVLLAELGLPFQRETHGWLDAVPDFLANSPIKRLPMLDRGPHAAVRFVYDSRVIAGVLYDLPAAPGRAKDLQPALYARAREDHDQNLLSALDAGLDAAINLFLMEKDGLTGEHSSYLRRQAARVGECFDWANRQYDGKTTLTPGQLAFVDIAAGAAVAWLRFRDRADVTRWPQLLRAEQALAARPSWSPTRPDAQ